MNQLDPLCYKIVLLSFFDWSKVSNREVVHRYEKYTMILKPIHSLKRSESKNCLLLYTTWIV